jgi:cytoskeleton protein RodZ
MSSTPFGEHLKREREMRGVSLEEISAATRISTRFLEAIEKDQWEQLPGGVFNRGFIRSIARFLGLDEDSLVAEYALGTTSSTDVRVTAHQAAEMPRNWRPLIVAIVTGVLVIVGAFVAYRRYGAAIEARLHRRSSGVSAAGPQATPQGTEMQNGSTPPGASAPVVAGEQPTLAAADTLLLKLEASNAANVKVTADGKVVFDGAMQANEVMQFDAHDAFEVSSTDSGALTLELNGHTMPPIGTPGQPGSVTLTPDNLKPATGGSH